jgi:hypothetical protein
MREVVIRIRFTSPSLGNVRGQDCDRFQRDKATGKVKFMASWWRDLLDYGAQALGMHQKEAKRVAFHYLVDGEPKIFRRFYKNQQYKQHEAFLEGDVIAVTAMVPEGLPLDSIKEMLNTAGKYQGISPYGWREDYGRFTVVDVAQSGKA